MIAAIWASLILPQLSGAQEDRNAAAGSLSARLSTAVDLATAQRIALEGNPGLQAAEARVEQAQARIRQARAAYFPRIDATASASFTELANTTAEAAKSAARGGVLSSLPSILFSAGTTGPVGVAFQLASILNGAASAGSAFDETLESYQAGLSFTYIVFDGFGRKFRKAVAEFGAKESDAALSESRRLLLSAVAIAYHSIQLARENIAIAHADVDFNRRQLVEAEARRRVGTGSLSDVLNFEVRVRAAQTALYRAEESRAVALVALAELLGVPESKLPDGFDVAELAEEAPSDSETPQIEALIVYAKTHRPDVLRARFAQERARVNVQAQRAPFFPSVNAFITEDARRSRNGLFNDEDFDSTVGLTLSYNLYAGGGRRAAVNEARAAEVEAERLLYDAELGAASQVRQSYEILMTAQKELVLQREANEYVERNRDLVEKEYQSGQGSLVRLNQAQRDLIAQQSQLALARVALRLSWHELRTATGETLEAFDGARD